MTLPDHKSIYLQIAENIEDGIAKGRFAEETRIPSTNQMASEYRINPATAAKGAALLVEEGILYKRRGIGLFVSHGSQKTIREKRKKDFYKNYVVSLFEEASKIGVTNQELIQMIIEGGKYYV